MIHTLRRHADGPSIWTGIRKSITLTMEHNPKLVSDKIAYYIVYLLPVIMFLKLYVIGFN